MAKQRAVSIQDIILVTRWLTWAGGVVLILLVLRGAGDVFNDLGFKDQLKVIVALIVAAFLLVGGYLLESAPVAPPPPSPVQVEPE